MFSPKKVFSSKCSPQVSSWGEHEYPLWTLPSHTHHPLARERRFERSWVGTSQVATDLPSSWLSTGWLSGWLAGLINLATDLLLTWFQGLGRKRQKIDKKGTKKSTHPQKKLKFCMKNEKKSRPPTSPNV